MDVPEVECEDFKDNPSKGLKLTISEEAFYKIDKSLKLVLRFLINLLLNCLDAKFKGIPHPYRGGQYRQWDQSCSFYHSFLACKIGGLDLRNLPGNTRRRLSTGNVEEYNIPCIAFMLLHEEYKLCESFWPFDLEQDISKKRKSLKILRDLSVEMNENLQREFSEDDYAKNRSDVITACSTLGFSQDLLDQLKMLFSHSLYSQALDDLLEKNEKENAQQIQELKKRIQILEELKFSREDPELDRDHFPEIEQQIVHDDERHTDQIQQESLDDDERQSDQIQQENKDEHIVKWKKIQVLIKTCRQWKKVITLKKTASRCWKKIRLLWSTSYAWKHFTKY